MAKSAEKNTTKTNANKKQQNKSANKSTIKSTKNNPQKNLPKLISSDSPQELIGWLNYKSIQSL